MVFLGQKKSVLPRARNGRIEDFKRLKSSTCHQLSGKKNWANPTFLWAANQDSAKEVKKSVKSEAKSPEMGQNFKTSYLGLGMAELRTLKG